MAPFLAIFLLFTAIPALIALFYSFTNMGVADIRHPFDVDFTFLDTFARVLTNAGFLKSLGTTGIFIAIGVPLTMAIGLALALALNSGIKRLRATYRAAFYLPVITNVVAAAVIWQYAFTLQGPVNTFLTSLGDLGRSLGPGIAEHPGRPALDRVDHALLAEQVGEPVDMPGQRHDLDPIFRRAEELAERFALRPTELAIALAAIPVDNEDRDLAIDQLSKGREEPIAHPR